MSNRDELAKCKDDFGYWLENYTNITMTKAQRRIIEAVEAQPLLKLQPRLHSTTLVAAMMFWKDLLQRPVDRHPDEQPAHDPDSQRPDGEPHGE